MAETIKISQLPESTNFAKLFTIATLDDTESRKVSLAYLLRVVESIEYTETDVDGEYNTLTITLKDGTTCVGRIKNGEAGTIPTWEDFSPEDQRAIVEACVAAIDIPDVYNATLSIKRNGVLVGTFTANQAQDKVIDITIPTRLADFSDDYMHRLVTDTEKLLWNGKYSKPTNGIPKGDLSSNVRLSLEKADTSVQPNDIADFVTRNVNDLVNYYRKDQTYTQAQVDALIGSIQNFHYEIAPSTASVQNPSTNVLYLIGPKGTGADRYEEYVYTNRWVKIGETSLDLSGYVTEEELDDALAEVAQQLPFVATIGLTTLDEIVEARTAGRLVVCRSSRSTGGYVVLTELSSDKAVFMGLTGEVDEYGDLEGGLSAEIITCFLDEGEVAWSFTAERIRDFFVAQYLGTQYSDIYAQWNVKRPVCVQYNSHYYVLSSIDTDGTMYFTAVYGNTVQTIILTSQGQWSTSGVTIYSKPVGGIPKSDLSQSVQDSLDLADGAVQAEPAGAITPLPDPYVTQSEFNALADEVDTKASQEEVSQLGQELIVKSTKNIFVMTGRTDAHPTGNWPISKYDVTDGVWYRGLAYSGYLYPQETNKVQITSVNNNSITFTQPIALYGLGFLVPVSSSTTYTLSVGSSSGSYQRGVIEVQADGTKITYYNVGPNPFTFTTSANTAFIVLCFYATSANATITLNNVQLEAGSSATEYEPAELTLKEALQKKQDTLTFDDAPTGNSNNPVKSGGVYSAIALVDGKADSNKNSIDLLGEANLAFVSKSKLIEHLSNPLVKTTIHLFGDSITQGMGSSDFSATGETIPNFPTNKRNVGAKSFAAMFAAQIEAMFNKDIWTDVGTNESVTKNYSIGGYTLEGDFFTNNIVGQEYLVFTFIGTHFSIMNYCGIYGGIYNIVVDGNVVQTVDTYASSGTYRQTDITGLANSSHEVKIVGTGTTSGSAQTNLIYTSGLLIPKQVEVINDGIGGLQSRAINNVVKENTTLNDNFVIWMAGTNDRAYGFYETQNAVIGVWNWLKTNRPNAKLIVMSANPCGENEYDDPTKVAHMDEINDAIVRMARALNICYISHYKYLARYCREQGVGISAICTDHVHPNDLGHMLIYQNMCKELNVSADTDF